MTKQRREPTLADKILAQPPSVNALYGSDWFTQGQQALRGSKRFVLDAQAARYLGEMIRDNPEVIADAQEFALRPFERMWVEFPFRPFYTAIHGHEPDDQSDTHLGYLYEGPVVRTASYSWNWDMKQWLAGWGQFEYVMHRPMPERELDRMLELLGYDSMGYDAWMWGDTMSHWIGLKIKGAFFRGSLKYLEQQAGRGESLRHLHSVRFPYDSQKLADKLGPQHQGSLRRLAEGNAGDMRNVVAVLLYLNRTRELQITKDLGQGGFFMQGRKPHPLLPHSVIGMKLDPKPVFLNLVQSENPEKRLVRLHDVKGHFCHDKASKRGCTHGIEQEGDFGELWIEYEPLKWRCERCGGLRWWRREHSRGSLHKGVVTQSYAVTR
jgi:hypothetical protein